MQISGMQLPKVTVKDLFEARVHLGHRVRYQNPDMSSYCFGIAQDLQIIDLDQSKVFLENALQFVASVIAKRGQILFVGTKQAANSIIREQAKRVDMPYVDHRWIPGALTNYNKILKPIKRLKDLDEKIKSGYLMNLTKKEGLTIMRERDKLDRSFSGIREMYGLPDALFILDVGQEKIALLEASKLSIPVIGIVDTNNSPKHVNYMIPGNDDNFRAIELYTNLIVDTILEAKRLVKATEPKKEAPAVTKVTVTKKKIATSVDRKKTDSPEKLADSDKTEDAKPSKPKVTRIMKVEKKTKVAPSKGENDG